MHDLCSKHFDMENAMSEKFNSIDLQVKSIAEDVRLLSESHVRLNDVLIGTIEEPGLIHTFNHEKEKFADHIQESNDYREKINFNHDICSRLSKNIDIVWHSFLSKLGAGIISSLITLVGVAWIIIKMG